MTEITQHKNVFVALAAAQMEMGAAVKGSINPAFKSKYADLADVVSAAAPALSKHGLMFYHYLLREERASYMITAIVHGESDTRIECEVPLIVGKQDMQGFKSATTYAKRIGLESVTGLAPEDDDGNAAAKNAPKAAGVNGAVGDKIGGDQFIALRDLLEQAGANETLFLAHFKIQELHDMPLARLPEADKLLRAKIAQKELADA